MTLQVPKNLETETNRRVLSYLEPLSCHSDIVEPLDASLAQFSDVEWFCPDIEHYKYCFWYVHDTIFAFATGMQSIGLRLPDCEHDRAASEGAVKCMEAGSDWYSFPWDVATIGSWSGIAYKYAIHL